MQDHTLLYSGKAKSLYATDDPDTVMMVFRDDASAFDGTKKAQLAGKGAINNRFNAFIMQHLAEAGIATHFVRLINETASEVKKLEMFPIECVVRNIAAGSLSKRLGVETGLALSPPTFEFFLKNDALHDPMINASHIRSLGLADERAIQTLESLTLAVNAVLKPLFLAADLLLVDYKLEFGRYHGEILLGDEFTPDGCRLWDKKTREKLDKDRFRNDLGDVVASYEEVAQRLGIQAP